MNETIQTLLSRRSIRKYKQDPIPEKELSAIVDAGIWAMSGMNQQSSKLAVIVNPDVRGKLYQLGATFPNNHGGANPFYDAPVVVLVFANKNAVTPIQDASLSIGNMANAAASLGIGSCWINCLRDLLIGSEEGRKLKKQFAPDDNDVPVGALVLGYPAQSPAAKPRNEGRAVYFK